MADLLSWPLRKILFYFNKLAFHPNIYGLAVHKLVGRHDIFVVWAGLDYSFLADWLLSSWKVVKLV